MSVPKHNPESTLNVWASVAKHRECLEYDVLKVTPKSAAWEEFSTHKVGRAVVAGDYSASPSREDCLDIVRMVEDENGVKVPVDEIRKVKPFRGSNVSDVEADYLHVEAVGVEILGSAQWGMFRELMLCYYPRKGPLRDERVVEPELFPWVLENYEGKDPTRDFHRRCRKMVKWFKGRV